MCVVESEGSSDGSAWTVALVSLPFINPDASRVERLEGIRISGTTPYATQTTKETKPSLSVYLALV